MFMLYFREDVEELSFGFYFHYDGYVESTVNSRSFVHFSVFAEV